MGNKKEKGVVVENLWCKIERLRQEMYVMALEKDISHPDVLMASQRLDKVINDLYKLVLTKEVG